MLVNVMRSGRPTLWWTVFRNPLTSWTVAAWRRQGRRTRSQLCCFSRENRAGLAGMKQHDESRGFIELGAIRFTSRWLSADIRRGCQGAFNSFLFFLFFSKKITIRRILSGWNRRSGSGGASVFIEKLLFTLARSLLAERWDRSVWNRALHHLCMDHKLCSRGKIHN